MNLTTLRTAAMALLLAGGALAPALVAHAAPGAQTAADIKAAVRARTAQASPGLVLDHIEISRVVGDYVAATTYPDLKVNETDPAVIILHKENGGWKAVAGPGTAFEPADLGGAPPEILPYDQPYTGTAADQAIATIPARKTFAAGTLGFQYPAAAVLDSAAPAGGAHLLGPQVGGLFNGPAYEITVRPLNTTAAGALDDWGYAKMQADIKSREAEAGAGGPGTQPIGAGYFHLASSDVFYIDLFGGDSLLRTLYVAPQGGGPIVEVDTRVYPVVNNPGAPQADAAVALLLHSLNGGTVPTTPGMPRTGAPTPWLLLLVAGALLGLAGTRVRRWARPR